MAAMRALTIGVGLIALWQAVVWLTGAPAYILPGPGQVLAVLWQKHSLVLSHATYTAAEILLGLAGGTLLGGLSAIVMTAFRPARRWLLPVLVVSQAIPVFALAPILVLWVGYGMASKVVMAILIIYFPVTAAFYDGLRRTDPGWLDLAQTMGARPYTQLRLIRLPAALPGFASGLRIATAVAPIGAIVGEWVGSSAGLGYLMLHANGRMQIDLMFAALMVLAALAVALYALVDVSLRKALPWQPETLDTLSAQKT